MIIKTIFKMFCTSLLAVSSMNAFADVQTDHLITQNVKAKIASDPSVSSANILVKTTDSVVILNGLVDTQSQKDAALKMAESVKDVLKVESNIYVRTAPERSNTGTQAPTNDQGAANVTASMPNTQSTEKANTGTHQATPPNSTSDSSAPVTIPPPPPNPNYNPVPPNYPASAPTTAPTNPTFGASSSQSP